MTSPPSRFFFFTRAPFGCGLSLSIRGPSGPRSRRSLAVARSRLGSDSQCAREQLERRGQAAGRLAVDVEQHLDGAVDGRRLDLARAVHGDLRVLEVLAAVDVEAAEEQIAEAEVAERDDVEPAVV